MEKEEIIKTVARRLSLPLKGVAAVTALLNDGATVPFIARYRKERTGNLDEVAVRDIELGLRTVADLFSRREFIRNAIKEAGALTDQLSRSLDSAASLTELEDLYAPYKPKKRTRATMAREKGLEPLADAIMAGRLGDCLREAGRYAGKKGVADAEEALAGAADIIAERASESPRLRNIARNTYRRSGELITAPAKGKEEDLLRSPYAVYADFSQRVGRMPSHQYLALRRAEKEGLLKVRYSIADAPRPLSEEAVRAFLTRQASDSCARVIAGAVEDSVKRLLAPSVESEVSASLKEEADRVAIDIFVQNLRQLLLSSPLKGRRILALDPGYRTGCKVVALDEQGKLLEDTVIYPVPPKADVEGARKKLETLIHRHRLDAISLGNGTASRETERFLKESRLIDSRSIFVVNESGASIYSASPLARKEFPDKDVTVRGAVSIGRRLLDPLAELVKIDPKSIGVGQYQHDVDQSALKEALDYTVMSCVNSVGVDLNTASESLLQYVSGIGPALAANIVAYREKEGPFASRRELLKVPRLGRKAFEQAAGFLRIPGGREPLDNTGIHPESYPVVAAMAARLGVRPEELAGNGQLLDRLDADALAREGIGGRETIADIISELRKPGRDPRTDDDNEAFQPGVEAFEELREGMLLPGIVENITAFGAFINLGIKEKGLLHISQISRKRISSVSDVLRLGQRLEVKVLEIDPLRHRISLSLLL